MMGETLPFDVFAQYLKQTPHRDAQAARAELIRDHGYTEVSEGFVKGDHLIYWQRPNQGPKPEKRAVPKPSKSKGGAS